MCVNLTNIFGHIKNRGLMPPTVCAQFGIFWANSSARVKSSSFISLLMITLTSHRSLIEEAYQALRKIIGMIVSVIAKYADSENTDSTLPIIELVNGPEFCVCENVGPHKKFVYSRGDIYSEYHPSQKFKCM